MFSDTRYAKWWRVAPRVAATVTALPRRNTCAEGRLFPATWTSASSAEVPGKISKPIAGRRSMMAMWTHTEQTEIAEQSPAPPHSSGPSEPENPRAPTVCSSTLTPTSSQARRAATHCPRRSTGPASSRRCKSSYAPGSGMKPCFGLPATSTGRHPRRRDGLSGLPAASARRHRVAPAVSVDEADVPRGYFVEAIAEGCRPRSRRPRTRGGTSEHGFKFEVRWKSAGFRRNNDRSLDRNVVRVARHLLIRRVVRQVRFWCGLNCFTPRPRHRS